ncbi:MAG: glycosyltransferase family 39 protein [Candidatus Sumerlaeia bacterium]|nr:glycosyltransferase family 39 protein [Candidatus Sumerlaeia bacterium]
MPPPLKDFLDKTPGPLLDRLPPIRQDVAAKIFLALLVFAGFMLLLRFVALGADFPAESRFARDGVLYTDEGWYANNAIAWARTGNWYNEGDMNFAPSLPIQQVFHAVSFSIFGVSAASARLSSAIPHVISALLAAWIAWRYFGRWSALLILLLMGTNYFFFTYSRLALAENLVQAFLMATAALLILARERYLVALSLAAGVCFALSVLTKTSGIVAGPGLLIAIWAIQKTWRDRIISAFSCFGIAGVMIVAHRIWLHTYFHIDAAFFSSINLGMNLDTDRFFAMVRRTIYRIRRVDMALYHLLIAMGVVHAVFNRQILRHPIVLSCVAFVGLYLLAFAVYANIQPRYWAAISAPLALLVAAGVKGFADLARRPGIGGYALPIVLGILVYSFVDNLWSKASYFTDLDYSFAEMSADVKARMDANPDVDQVLLGHFSTTLALYEDLRWVNDIYGADPLEYRLRLHRPQYMITEDVYTEDTHRRGPIIRGEPMFGERVEVVDHFYEIEEIAVYKVLRNYKDYHIHFYRLHERLDVDWEIPADYPTELREVPIAPERRGDADDDD